MPCQSCMQAVLAQAAQLKVAVKQVLGWLLQPTSYLNALIHNIYGHLFTFTWTAKAPVSVKSKSQTEAA